MPFSGETEQLRIGTQLYYLRKICNLVRDTRPELDFGEILQTICATNGDGDFKNVSLPFVSSTLRKKLSVLVRNPKFMLVMFKLVRYALWHDLSRDQIDQCIGNSRYIVCILLSSAPRRTLTFTSHPSIGSLFLPRLDMHSTTPVRQCRSPSISPIRGFLRSSMLHFCAYLPKL